MARKYLLKNGEELIIREATPEDAAKLVDYIKKVADESDYLTFNAEEFKMSIEGEKEFIQNINQKNNCIALIAEVKGRIVGNLNFMGSDRSRLRHRGEFGISVLKEFWGQGIGALLLTYLIEWSKETKVIRKINLKVREDNKRAIELYKRFGFKEEGVISRYFRINNKFYNALVMGLEI